MNKKKRIKILETQVKQLLTKSEEYTKQISAMQQILRQSIPFGPPPKTIPKIPEIKISNKEIKKIVDSLNNIKLPRKKRKKANEPDFDIIPPPLES